MEKLEVLKNIREEKIIAVVRAESKEQGEKTVDAIVNGGINLIEITMTVPGAIDIIKELIDKYKNDKNIIIGAGTVLDEETARLAILAGANYIVSPHLNPQIIKMCNRYAVPSIPGIMTTKEAVEALELGVDILKVFPGNAFGPSIIKALKGPLPQANFMPTGGVSTENVHEWFAAGAIAVGTGGNLTAGAKKGDYDLVTKTAKEFVEAVKNSQK